MQDDTVLIVWSKCHLDVFFPLNTTNVSMTFIIDIIIKNTANTCLEVIFQTRR